MYRPIETPILDQEADDVLIAMQWTVSAEEQTWKRQEPIEPHWGRQHTKNASWASRNRWN